MVPQLPPRGAQTGTRGKEGLVHRENGSVEAGRLPGATAADAYLGTRLSSGTPCEGDSEFTACVCSVSRSALHPPQSSSPHTPVLGPPSVHKGQLRQSLFLES